MSETKKSAGRPMGAKAADRDAEIDRIILNRRDQEADNREAANNTMRRAISRYKARQANRQAWIAHHDRQSHIHQALADEHKLAKVELERGA